MYEEIYKKTLFNRLGGITFRIAIFALIVAALTMLSGVLYGLYAFTMVILILITILITLFIILIYFPNIKFSSIEGDAAGFGVCCRRVDPDSNFSYARQIEKQGKARVCDDRRDNRCNYRRDLFHF